jgi:ribosome recycling factor
MNGLIITETLSPKDFEKRVLEEMKKTVDFFEREIAKLRTNRAHASLVEDIRVQVYGQQMPLKNLAVITVPEATVLLIQPFDTNTIIDIEKALSTCDLGGQPRNDGKMIKIILPPMSQARRMEMMKVVSKKQEEALVGIRKVRQDVVTLIKQSEKDKKVSEDTSARLQKLLQTLLDSITNTISQITKKKEVSLSE